MSVGLTMAFALAFALLAHTGHAGDHDHAAHGMPVPSAAALRVTINPEARVSVAIGSPLPVQPCGGPIEIAIEVYNNARIAPKLVATALSTDFEIVAQPAPALTGATRERRRLTIALRRSPPVDVELAFDVGPVTQDLGGRSATHLLIRCTP